MVLGGSSFIEAAIALNLASSFWKPFQSFIEDLPSSMVSEISEKGVSLIKSNANGDSNGDNAAGEEVSESVANSAVSQCNKHASKFERLVKFYWKLTQRLGWAASTVGVFLLYLDCVGPWTALLMIPIPLYLFAGCLTGFHFRRKVRSRLKSAGLALKQIDEAMARKELIKFTTDAEAKLEEHGVEGDEGDQ